MPEPARAAWPAVVELFRTLGRAPAPATSPAQVHAVRSVYGPLLERRYDNVQARLRDLEQIEALASRAADRAQFLAELVLDPPAYTQELAGPPLLDEDYLILSTMHSAKGLEFDVVYVIHAADGNIPSDMATGSREEIEEERRLLLRRLHARPRAALRHPPAALLHAAVGQGRHARLRAALALPQRGRRAALRRGTGAAASRSRPTRARSPPPPRPRSAPASARSGAEAALAPGQGRLGTAAAARV